MVAAPLPLAMLLCAVALALVSGQPAPPPAVCDPTAQPPESCPPTPKCPAPCPCPKCGSHACKCPGGPPPPPPPPPPGPPPGPKLPACPAFPRSDDPNACVCENLPRPLGCRGITPRFNWIIGMCDALNNTRFPNDTHYPGPKGSYLPPPPAGASALPAVHTLRNPDLASRAEADCDSTCVVGWPRITRQLRRGPPLGTQVLVRGPAAAAARAREALQGGCPLHRELPVGQRLRARPRGRVQLVVAG
jgi:hypothetical protein